MLLCLLLYNERKDYDDDWSLSRRQKVLSVERILSKNTQTSCLREKREKRRERKEEREKKREKEESAVRRKRSAKKKDEKNSLPSAFCFCCLLFESKKIKEKEQV